LQFVDFGIHEFGLYITTYIQTYIHIDHFMFYILFYNTYKCIYCYSRQLS